jgi:hypothetical protein
MSVRRLRSRGRGRPFAHRAGLRRPRITNGYWAVYKRTADARVAALRAAGLVELVLSTATCHQRFVPVARIAHAARATVAASIPTRISVETCDQQTFDDAPLRVELRDALASGRVGSADDRAQPVDRRRRRPRRDGADPPVAGRRRLRTPAGGCAAVTTTLSVTPDQRLVACCGFPLEELLELGSVPNARSTRSCATRPTGCCRCGCTSPGRRGSPSSPSRTCAGDGSRRAWCPGKPGRHRRAARGSSSAPAGRPVRGLSAHPADSACRRNSCFRYCAYLRPRVYADGGPTQLRWNRTGGHVTNRPSTRHRGPALRPVRRTRRRHQRQLRRDDTNCSHLDVRCVEPDSHGTYKPRGKRAVDIASPPLHVAVTFVTPRFLRRFAL